MTKKQTEIKVELIFYLPEDEQTAEEIVMAAIDEIRSKLASRNTYIKNSKDRYALDDRIVEKREEVIEDES